MAQVTYVRLTVELPEPGIENQKDSAIYVAGTFNNWNPGDTFCIMKRIDRKHYSLDIPCFRDKEYEYKYTMGSWKGVEKKADGNDIDNRRFKAGKRMKIKDRILGWSIPAPVNVADTATFLNKEQMASLMALKDSLGKSLPAYLPQLLGLLQKVTSNLLAEQPDESLSKQYNQEAGQVVATIFEKLGVFMKQAVQILTPEQKQKLRDMLKDANGPKDIIGLMGKLAPGGSQ